MCIPHYLMPIFSIAAIKTFMPIPAKLCVKLCSNIGGQLSISPLKSDKEEYDSALWHCGIQAEGWVPCEGSQDTRLGKTEANRTIQTQWIHSV